MRVVDTPAWRRVLHGGASLPALGLMSPVLAAGELVAGAAGGNPGARLAVAGAAFALAWIVGFGLVQEFVVVPRWRSRSRRMGDAVAFGFGWPGHVAFIGLGVVACAVCVAAAATGRPGLGLVAAACVAMAVGVLVLLSPFSPWRRGPALVATSHGVQIAGYRVPWTAIEAVGVSRDGVRGAWIRTRVTLSAYARNRAARQTARAGRTLHVPPVGATPQALCAYLQGRCDIETRRAAAREANARASGEAERPRRRSNG